MSKSSELASVLGDLVQATHRITRLAAQAAGSTESPATWRTIAVLHGSGPLRLGELAAQSRVSQPTMTNLVAGLEERGWVQRRPDSSDARASRVEATREGLTALDEWRTLITAELLPHFEDLTDDELQILKDAVAIVSARVAVSGAGVSAGSASGAGSTSGAGAAHETTLGDAVRA